MAISSGRRLGRSGSVGGSATRPAARSQTRIVTDLYHGHARGVRRAGSGHVSDGEFPIDPRAPLFFLSYAHVTPPRHSQVGPHEGNRHAMRLFDELSDHVSGLVGRPTGANPGFIDRAVDGGERWTWELLTAAGTCQVFIPLISKPYVDSEWCGTEWDAFSRRRIVRRADGSTDHETGIVPVTWAPTD